ncbi:MAG: hypothetical protein C4539_04200 [Ignavibacteriales bacterium]|nr:MAG: hypothetical protein C4539_04200 [Ignavibacteriales bacterium]
MTQENKQGIKIFKYNMSFYYQSTIIYFIAFVCYAILVGQFGVDEFKLITHDPVIYFFALVVLLSIIILLYNLYLRRHIEITENAILFKKGSKEKEIRISDIKSIGMTREKKNYKATAFTVVKIHIKDKRFPITIIPFDFENSHALMEFLVDIKKRTGN